MIVIKIDNQGQWQTLIITLVLVSSNLYLYKNLLWYQYMDKKLAKSTLATLNRFLRYLPGWHSSLSSQAISGLNQAKVDGREKVEESLNMTGEILAWTIT